MNKLYLMIGAVTVFGISGCDVIQLMAFKNAAVKPEAVMQVAVTDRYYSVTLLTEHLRTKDLGWIGLEPDSKSTGEGKEVWRFHVRNVSDASERIWFTVEVDVMDEYVRCVRFPSSFAAILPPAELIKYVRRLATSDYYPRLGRTVPSSPRIGRINALNVSSGELEALVGPPVKVSHVGTNRESRVADLRVGNSSGAPFRLFALCRKVPSRIEELDLLFGRYRLRLSRELVDLVILPKRVARLVVAPSVCRSEV